MVTSRNDNHGGDLTKRMRIFLRGLRHQCRVHGLAAEVIFVEWNPPADRPLLHELLPGPDPDDTVSVRYVIVPEEIHQQYKRSDVIPLFQMIAKNVGIRRAEADFILCTNIDLLFSDALMKQLCDTKLRKGTFYRANRCDVPADIDESKSVGEQLRYCEENVFARHGYNPEYLNLIGVPGWVFKFPVLRLLDLMMKPLRSVLVDDIYNLMSKTDFHACGDFTLMHRDDWMAIEGYPELDLYSIHVDSMALTACIALGMEQYIFPREACTYHIHHEDGWSAMSPIELIRFIEKRPSLDWSVFYEAGKRIIRERSSFGLNGPDWGFAKIEFKEIVQRP